MGTLTGGMDRLPGFCDHKLPTSCRLTSILECCACADERAHSATYPTYIDGVGFVSRGTRWQRYCWFCKEFWENRVRISGLPPSRTQVPLVPDQSTFLNAWYEFHRGYRVEEREDGVQVTTPVAGEPWSNVPPGYLPRTPQEVEAGADYSAADQPQQVVLMDPASQTGPTLEETLDAIIEAADTEELPGANSRAHRQSATSRNHSRTLAPSSGITDRMQMRLNAVDPRLGTMELEMQQLETSRTDARQRLAEAELMLTRANEERMSALQFVDSVAEAIHSLSARRYRVLVEQRTQDNFRRVFGSREDIEREDYVAPITGLFQRAWQWHERQQQTTANGQTDQHLHDTVSTAQDSNGAYEARLDGTVPQARVQNGENARYGENGAPRYEMLEMITPTTYRRTTIPLAWARLNSEFPIDPLNDPVIRHVTAEPFTHGHPRAQPAQGLDIEDERPEPLSDEQMTFKHECKVCLMQIPTIAVFPCGHLVMCEWCAAQVCPPSIADRTRPLHKGLRCPLCRKHIKQRLRVHMP